MKTKQITREQALEWTEPCESPIPWRKYALLVVRDGCDVWDGTRIHFVTEEGFDGGILDNAYVFSI